MKKIIQLIDEAMKAGIEEPKKVYYICPFCSEDDFDLVGLKYHLFTYCAEFEKIDMYE